MRNLLAYLVWQGIKAMRPRTTAIGGRCIVVPAIFIVGGCPAGFGQQGNIWPLVAWIAAALVSMPVGVLTPRPFEVEHATGRIIRPGSIYPLIRNLIVFGLQYTVAVLAAIHVDDHGVASIAGRAVSGAMSGYFIGSTIA